MLEVAIQSDEEDRDTYKEKKTRYATLRKIENTGNVRVDTVSTYQINHGLLTSLSENETKTRDRGFARN